MDSEERGKNLGVIKFFSEVYMLKRTKRAGLSILDAPQDSIADHVVLTAQIAYVLARMEGLNPERCATMALFHDNDETRIGDLHKIATLYLEKDPASLRAIGDQLRGLPREIERGILELIMEEKKKETPEAIIVRDADWLEMALQAKILEEKGYRGAKDWFEWIEERLQTESAKIILAEVKRLNNFTGCWWENERGTIIEKEKKKEGRK